MPDSSQFKWANGERDRGQRLEEAVGYVRSVVRMFRRRGHKTEEALTKVAAILGISADRARNLHYRNKVWSIVLAEADRIEVRFAMHLETEIQHALDYVDELRAEKNLLETKLVGKCSDVSGGASYSAHGRGFGSRGRGYG